MKFNNLQAKAKTILKQYSAEMDENVRYFYTKLTNSFWITKQDIEIYNFCEFRYRAKNNGFI